jgi:hypothetical protein
MLWNPDRQDGEFMQRFPDNVEAGGAGGCRAGWKGAMCTIIAQDLEVLLRLLPLNPADDPVPLPKVKIFRLFPLSLTHKHSHHHTSLCQDSSSMH